ncbi:MAG: COX15/CtaA family protein [Gammaproteobacteria bacterium]|jgi:cytochrome c oxidase assembly protein subunit 15|nr:COX15/CtaA family protein [Gammaproteobacteria bacterium]
MDAIGHNNAAGDSLDRLEVSRKWIALWLYVCCALIFAMVVLGGVTRLTGSGLSMVEWNPVFGIVPPLNETEWQEVFDKYKASPEYRKVNLDMDVSGFKRIFLVEYAHRVLGRLIGIVFLLPLLFFFATRRIPPGLTPKLVAMFVLGASQGLLGWYMVKSGLVDDPHVSQYRLTAHFMLAVAIYAYMLWVAFGLWPGRPAEEPARGSLRRLAYGLIVLLFVTMTSGGFVAGLKAGKAYNTFPLMDGKLVPDGLFEMQPWYLNLFENATTVQFNHRIMAVLVFLIILDLWSMMLGMEAPRRARIAIHLLLIAILAQVALGISTLLLQVPIPLASAHQAGALSLLAITLFSAHQLRGST